MSILEKMREYEAQRISKLQGSGDGLLGEPEPSHNVSVQGFGLKPRRPSIKNMIGDNNPLSDEDFQMLGEMFKFGRVTE